MSLTPQNSAVPFGGTTAPEALPQLFPNNTTTQFIPQFGFNNQPNLASSTTIPLSPQTPQPSKIEPIRGKRRTKLSQSADRAPTPSSPKPDFESLAQAQFPQQTPQINPSSLQQIQLAQQIQFQILQQMQLNHLQQLQALNPQLAQAMAQTMVQPTIPYPAMQAQQANPLGQYPTPLQMSQPFQMPLPVQTPLPQLQQIQQYQQMLQKLQSPFTQPVDPFGQPKPEMSTSEPTKQNFGVTQMNTETPHPPATPSETPKFELGQYDFNAMSEATQREQTTQPKVGNKRRSRNTPPRPSEYDRSKQANNRMRDSNGSFTSKQKTDVLDLTFKLHSSEFECNKLRQEVAGKDQEMAELRAKLQESERRAQEQLIRVQFLEMVQQRQALEHLDFIRSFKARTQYLSQLEKVFEDKRRREEGVQTSNTNPSLSPQISTPQNMQEDSNLSVSSPDVKNLSLNENSMNLVSEQTQNMNVVSPQAAMNEVPNLYATSPVGLPPENPFTFQHPQPPHPHPFQHPQPPHPHTFQHPVHPQHAVPATWFNYESLWNESVLPAFREKIDFSTIQLRHYGSPNIVEQAKMEYYEAHRRWQEQLQQVNNLPLSPRPKTPKHKPANAFHPASFAKIDFSAELSRLKKINSVAKQNEPYAWELLGGSIPTADPNASMTPVSPVSPVMHPQLPQSQLSHSQQEQILPQPIEEESKEMMLQETSSISPDTQQTNSLFLNGMEEFPMNDHMDMCMSPTQSHVADEHDEWLNGFFHVPTPTAVIWRAELEKKGEYGKL